MRIKLQGILVAAGVALLMTSAFGCKGAPSQDEVCEHMAKFMDEGKYTKEECMKDLNKHVVEKCSNVDEVYKCLTAAADEAGVGKCEEVCKKK